MKVMSTGREIITEFGASNVIAKKIKGDQKGGKRWIFLLLVLKLLIVSVLIHSCKEKTQAHHKKIKIVIRSCGFASLKFVSFD